MSSKLSKRLKSLSSFWAGLFVITSLIVIAYYNTITSPFNFDDESAIIDNESIRSLSNIPDRITNIFSRPVLFISFTINYHIGGLDPTGYHLVNIALHTAVSILIYIIVRHTVKSGVRSQESRKVGSRESGVGSQKTPDYRLPTTGYVTTHDSRLTTNFYLLPFLSALIFAVHPINTESVTYIASRSSVLSTFFYLLSLLMFIKGAKTRRQKTEDRRQTKIICILFSVFCILFFLLAIGTKEDAATLPAILLLYHFFFISEEKGFKGYFKRYGWVILSLGFLIISYPLLRYIRLGIVGTSEARDIFTPFTYLMTGIKVIIYYYMRLLLIPINLNVDPHIRAVNFPNFYVLSALSLTIAILIIVLRRKNGLLSFSLLWYFTAIFPTTSIFPLNDAASEHRIYLPAVGFCIFMASSLTSQVKVQIYRLRPAVTFLTIIIILMFSTLTIKRNFIWGEEALVWKDSTKKSPNKPRPYYNMAISYEKMGFEEKAIWGYKGTLEHLKFREQPHFWTESHIKLAGIYVQKGMHMKAIPLYDAVLKMYPEKPEALNGLAVIHLKLNQFEKAKEILEKAIKIKPDYAEAHNNLGTAYARMGMLEEAMASFKKAIKIRPRYEEARLNYGIVKGMMMSSPEIPP